MSMGIETVVVPPAAARRGGGTFMRSFAIGLTAFLTVVDLFATQAILPSLAKAYNVSAGEIGFAVNACTLGMAVGALGTALFGERVERRLGIIVCLALLAVPTAMLAVAPDLASFASLRVAQGLFMSTAFALTLSYLAEHCSVADTAGAFAAYVTGNVASNLIGRMMSAAFTDHLGLAGNFWIFAALNLAGAVFVYFSLGQNRAGGVSAGRAATVRTALATHLANPGLRAAFMIGFLILFAFIGTFTYVNFVLVRAPLALSRMQVGLVYLVFLPSILSTPLAGHVVARYGAIASLRAALALAASGLPLLLLPQLAAVMAGLALIGVGTFFAQAVATGFVGRAATTLRGAASGMYLASYFSGGLVGSLVLGQLFDRAGWAACVGGIAVAFALALMLASRLALPRSVRAD